MLSPCFEHFKIRTGKSAYLQQTTFVEAQGRHTREHGQFRYTNAWLFKNSLRVRKSEHCLNLTFARCMWSVVSMPRQNMLRGIIGRDEEDPPPRDRPLVHQASCLVGLRWLAAMRTDSFVGGEAALPSCQLGCGDGKCERDGKMQLEQLCGLHKFSQIFSQICVNEMRVWANIPVSFNPYSSCAPKWQHWHTLDFRHYSVLHYSNRTHSVFFLCYFQIMPTLEKIMLNLDTKEDDFDQYKTSSY